jgi:hypothetical protein
LLEFRKNRGERERERERERESKIKKRFKEEIYAQQ